MMWSAFVLAAALSGAPALPGSPTTSPAQEGYTNLPDPEVGSVAQPLGSVTWRQLPAMYGGREPELIELRGKVVVVQTWVWFCDACVKHGVPAVVDAHNANSADGLVVISLSGQNQREDVSDDHWLAVGQQLGMQHALGETSYFGEYSPYFNLNKNSSPTYGFIIGKSGLVRWRGDLGTKTDEFFVALREALEAPAGPALPASLDAEFAKALGAWLEGDFDRALAETLKVERRYAKKSSQEALLIAAQAEALAASLQGYASELLAEARRALAASHAEPLARALATLASGFNKGETGKQLKALHKQLAADAALEGQVEAWFAWYELSAERPATFPARRDKAGERYAKQLARFVARSDDGPGAQRAQSWLQAWERTLVASE